ncbi:thymidylate synthase [Streptomyces sp. NPDC002133]|uniref:thymidylate synthase n=1 Tax=Streptomyces sp. NPDC002133 TaxID=3154409 RepID=UPI00332563CC
MLTPPVFDDFESAYLEVIRHITDTYDYRNAPRGNTARECIGLSFQIANPRERLPYLAARKINPVFHFAEALWYMAGRTDLDMIGHYASRMRLSSRDGTTIVGSAYGSRIFNPVGTDTMSPFDRVISLLRNEADSKRGLMPIFTADELALDNNPDMSCVVALHLLARRAQLHMVCYMRANDCDRGLLSDVFSFTMIQELAAVQLGLDVGTYTHHIGSAHIGDRDYDRVRRILAEASTRPEPVQHAFPAMPADTSLATIGDLLMHEERLRNNKAQYTPDDIAGLGFAPYWQQVLLLFEAYRQIRYCEADPVDKRVQNALAPGLRWLMARRWPARISEGSTQ